MLRRFRPLLSINPAASAELQEAASAAMAGHGGLAGEAIMAASKPSTSPENAAQRLKCACNEILAKYQNVPPDVFLKRARAYEELNQPYFALADYSMASESVQVDKVHVTHLMKTTKELPAEIRINFPGTNLHLNHHVTPYLSKSVKVATDSGLGGGRSVVATEDIRSHDVIVKRHQPWISYPAFDSHCACCGSLMGPRVIACGNPSCHEEYCSRDCRSAALLSYHGGTCTNNVFQTLELELYSKFKAGTDRTQQNEAMLHLLALRLVSYGLTQKIKPTALAEVQTLSGSVLASPVQMATSMHEFHYRVCRAANVRTTLSLEEFMCLMAKIQSNLFQDDSTFYLSLPRSMINHSCNPNCSELGGQIVALQPIKKGEECTISYFPSIVGLERENRLQELKKRGFECQCAVCMSGK